MNGPARMASRGAHCLLCFEIKLAGRARTMTMTRGEEEDEEGGRAVLRLQPFLSYARVKRNSGVDWASFLLFFLLGHRIEGTFHCRKSRSGNTRELDVEIHWKVLGPNEREGDVQPRYDVFRVC
jgi:hypothetical protein